MKKIIAIIVITILVLTGCTIDTKNTISSLRVGFFPNITHAQALIGMQNGIYEKKIGVPIEWKKFNAGPAEVEALFAGELDLAFIGPGPAINAYAKSNGDVQIIAGVAQAGAILVASKQSGITNIKMLSGKKIAVPQFGNTQDLCLRSILLENGLKDTTKGGTVEIIQVANSDVQGLLEKGEIDGALVPEPWGALLEKNTSAFVVLDANEIWRNGNYPTAVIVVRKEFLINNKLLVENFLKAHLELTNFLKENTIESADIINQEMFKLTKKNIDKEVLTKALNRIKFTNDPEKEAIIDMVDLSLTSGFLKEKPDLSTLFDLTLINLDSGQ